MASSNVSLNRPRLTQLLTSTNARATFVIAPAGFGKTALLREYAETVEAPVVWLNAAEPLASADTFAAELLRRLTADAAEAGTLNQVLASRGSLTVVVDNCHHLVGRGFDGFRSLCSLIEDPGLAHVRWLVAGRPVAGLAIARLRLAGLADSLDGRDLAFTVDEVREYLAKVWAKDVAAAEAQSRQRKVGGWIAGLVLTEGAARPSALQEYVEQEIAASMGPELRAFVTRCALLGRLEASLCEEVLGIDGAGALLQQLERLHVLSDGQLIEPLRQVFAASLAPGEARELRLRAAAAHRARREWPMAARYVAQAEAWVELRALLEEHGREMLELGRPIELVQLLEQLRATLALGASLDLLRCEALGRIGHVSEVKTLLPGLDEVSPAEKVRVDILRTWLALAGGDHKAAAIIGRETLKSPQASELDRAYLHHWLAMICRALGDRQQAMRHHGEAIQLFERLGYQGRVAYEQTQIGITHRESGDASGAEPLLRDAVSRLRELGRWDYLPAALGALAVLLLELERPEETIELLSEAEWTISANGDTYFIADVLHTAGTLYRALGRTADALDALRRSAEVASALGYVALEQRSNLDWAIMMADLGKLDDAEQVVQNIERVKPIARVMVHATVARARIAWLRHEDGAVLRLCSRLAEMIRTYDKHEYAPLPLLLRLAVLVRSQAATTEVDTAAVDFLHGPYPRLSVLMFRDAAAVAWRGVRNHPDPAVRNNAIWKATSRWTFARDVDPRRRHPERISVSTLHHALRVEVDGVLFKHGWLRALDLFLYLIHVPDGGTANEIASALWGAEQRREITIQKRFHSMVSALRQLLGEETILRDSSAPPGRYLLNPDIELDYDVAEFVRLGEAALVEGQHRAERIQAARDRRADSYWPARNLRSPWFLKISQQLEATYARLEERAAELERSVRETG